MRNGLTKMLAENFPNTLPKLYVGKVNQKLNKYLDPNWICGFTEGKGSFSIEIVKQPCSPVKLNFQIILNESEKELLALIINLFKCGTIKITEGGSSLYKIFTVTNFEDISNIIIPFFKNYPLQGIKKLDFDNFIKVAGELIKSKAHWTSTVFNKIKQDLAEKKDLEGRTLASNGKSIVINKRSSVQIRHYSSVSSFSSPLNPWWVTGFSDAESSFILKFSKSTNKVGWTVKPTFAIHIHTRDIDLLYKLQSYFGGGIIYDGGKSTVQFSIQSIGDLKLVLAHFDKYPLKTQKRSDFELFKLAIGLINKKEHLTKQGIEKIISIRASLNKGLTPLLAEYFPNLVPVKRPITEFKGSLDSNWLAGFTEGEGCFNVTLFKAKTTTGLAVKLEFILTQHIRDQELMTSFTQFFK